MSGSKKRKPHDKKAEDALQRAIDEANKLEAPVLGSVNYDDYEYIGDLTPEQIAGAADVGFTPAELERAVATTMGPSAFEGISTDPALRAQQMASMGALQDLAESGGMTAMDRANLARVQGQASQADRGRREAILANQRARGMGGSGNELLAQLASSQAATDSQSQAGLDIAGMAQQRALDAMLRSGELAGGIRGQDWGEAAQKASATDAIANFNASQMNDTSRFNAGAANNMSQFNTGNQLRTDMYNTDNALNTQQFNAGMAYDANKSSWGARQGTADKNTGVQNDQKTHNQYTVPMSNFSMNKGVVDTRVGANNGATSFYTHQGDQAQDGQQNLFTGIIQGGAAVAGAKSDERAKKNIKDVEDGDLDHFLSCLKPATFEYKDKKDGQGERTGPMAQDLLKSKLGADTVMQMEDGELGVDRDKLQGVLVAAIKHLSEKIDGKKKG